MRLTSTQNSAVKYVRSLETAAARRENGVFLVEGVRLVGEAIGAGQKADLALIDPVGLQRTAAGVELLARLDGWAEKAFEVDERVLRAAASTQNPAGVVAVLRRPHIDLDVPPAGRLGLVLDRLADPGNVGTIIRTAEAAGVDYVIAVRGTTDLFAPKVVRAAMGAHFRLKLICDLDWADLDGVLRGVDLIGLDTHASVSVFDRSWPERLAIVTGSEAHGLGPEARSRVNGYVRIPMREPVESLNVAVATAIVLFAIPVAAGTRPASVTDGDVARTST